MASNSRPPPPTIGSPKDLDTFAFVWKVVVALIAPSHCFIASPSPHPPQVSGNNAMDVRLVPENGNVIACLGVEYLSPQRIDPAEPQYLSVHRGFPHQPVTVHERHVHPARIGRNFLSSTVLVDCRGRGQVTVCERHWYCAWLCQTCSTKTQWCYDFSSIHTSCRVFVEKLIGPKRYREVEAALGYFSRQLSSKQTV